MNSRVYSTRSGKPNYEKMFKNLVNDILTAPTVDTERHAHWIIKENAIEEFSCYVDGYVCSDCFKMTDEEYAYCPNCGCKMDEVVGNE